MGLSEGTFKVLSDPEEEIRGRASRGRHRAVDTGTDGKEAGDSTSTGDWEKQPGGDPMDAVTGDTNTSQAVVKGTPAEPEPTTERDS
jgi:Na+-translocating ferredoxin:NAD+ oxidoreductase RnfG subunit